MARISGSFAASIIYRILGETGDNKRLLPTEFTALFRKYARETYPDLNNDICDNAIKSQIAKRRLLLDEGRVFAEPGTSFIALAMVGLRVGSDNTDEDKAAIRKNLKLDDQFVEEFDAFGFGTATGRGPRVLSHEEKMSLLSKGASDLMQGVKPAPEFCEWVGGGLSKWLTQQGTSTVESCLGLRTRKE